METEKKKNSRCDLVTIKEKETTKVDLGQK